MLISLINAIVSEEDQVAEVTLPNPYNAQNFRQDKLSILDIKAKGKERAEGLAEAKAAIAKEMLDKNMTVSMIATITGPTEAEVAALKAVTKD